MFRISQKWSAFILSPLAFCLVPCPAIAQDVQWRTNYNLARKEALATNRPLLLDFGTEQCFWCRRLEATTFRDAHLVLLLNESFIPLKIDADRDTRLAEALHIRSFPTLVLAAPDGRILGTLEGYSEAGPLQEQLQRVLAELRQQEARVQARASQARQLLAQAQEAYRTQQYLCCLDRCERLASSFADLPEGAEGVRLAAEIMNNPQWLQQACQTLTDRLGGLYLALAEICIKKNQPQQAARYLERVLQIDPGTPQAETARVRLSNLPGSNLPGASLSKQ